eukprot:6471746-Amphidinium_carterae.1
MEKDEYEERENNLAQARGSYQPQSMEVEQIPVPAHPPHVSEAQTIAEEEFNTDSRLVCTRRKALA